MNRQLLFFSLVALAGLLCLSAWETPERIDTNEEFQMVGRKLMQEKTKPKSTKGDSQAPKKLAGGDGKKSFELDGSKEVVVPKGGKLKKEKRALDEEDDDDIRFMEEEKSIDVSHPKLVDSGRDDAAAGKSKDSGKKNKMSRKAGKKSEDVMEVEGSGDGDVKKESGVAKEKKALEKTKGSRGKKSKKPVHKPGEDVVLESKKPEEELVVEKIVDEDDSGTGDQKAGDRVKTSPTRKPAEDVEIEKIEDDGSGSGEVDDVKEDEPVRKQKKVDVIEEETGGFAEEASSDGETQDDVIMPVNIKEDDDEKPVENKSKGKQVEKKPSTKEQNKPKTKEEKQAENNSKPSADAKAKTPVKTTPPEKKTTATPTKTTPPEKKATNSTKKSIDQKTTAEPTMKGKPLKPPKQEKKDKPLKQEKKEMTSEKKEQIPINFSGGAVEDVEDLQVGTVPTEVDEDDDELNFVDEVTRLPTKFQETAGQVKETLLPGFEKLSEKSRSYFASTNKQITERFAPILGEQVAPVVASLISYALLLMPLILVLYMLERIRASLSLAKVLFFVNIYLGAYFLTLVLATFALHSEPMAFLFRNARSSCVFLQLLQALGFLLYVTLYTVVFVRSCSNAGFLDKLAAGFQWVIVGLFGLHYYVTVFHRTMAMKLPKTNWKIYLVYSSAFAVLALFARAKIEPSKKEYYYSPVDDPDEVIPVDKRS